MRVYKKTYKGPDGEPREYGKYTVEIRDVRGKARRFTGYADKRLSENLGRKLDLLVATVKNRDPLSPDLSRWLETAPENLKKQLLRFGLIEPRQVIAGEPLETLLGQFITHLKSKRRTAVYIGFTERQLRGIFKRCGFNTWADCDTGKFESFLDSLRQRGRSARTVNSYIAAFRAFSNFLLSRELVQPIPGIKTVKKQNENEDRRKVRRSLTGDEIRRLLEAARQRPLVEAGKLNRGPAKGRPGAQITAETESKLRMLGRERSLCYKVAFTTGLRRKELGSIRVVDVRLSAIPQKIVLAAKDEKARRGAELPLRADVAAELADYIRERGISGDDRLFVVPELRTFKRDCEFAGIALVDDRGRSVDFHALRTSLGSHLAAAGVHPRTSQEIMRHSDISLTMKHYVDPLLLDLRGALDSLPKFEGKTDAKKIG